MKLVARLQPCRLPDAAVDAVPILLACKRHAEAIAFVVAVIRNMRTDAKLEQAGAIQRRRKINLDFAPAVSVCGNRLAANKNCRLVEHAFHDQEYALALP